MDSGSVISLSSTSSKGSTESLASILTVSSEVQRIPVSWESDLVSRRSTKIGDFDKTPQPSEKVNEWMKSCDYNPQNEEPLEELVETNQSTCIRYDFDKSAPTSSQPKSCFTRTTPLFSYMEEAKKTSAKSGDSPRKNGNHVNKLIDCDTPLSPDSHKKELCSYLQLMKPGEKKQEIFYVEYRRSARVKNLVQTVEKKKIDQSKEEEKMCSDDTKRIVSDKPSSPTVKSCAELVLKANKLDISPLKRKKEDKIPNKYLPLPPKRAYRQTVDFDDCIKEIVGDGLKKKSRLNRFFRKVANRRKFKFGRKPRQLFKKGQFSFKRINSLRSKGRLRNISLDTLILRKSPERKKARKKMLKEFKKRTIRETEKRTKKDSDQTIQKEVEKITQETTVVPNIESPRCEIISVHTNSDDENVDLKNFVDDMLELDKMSEEHRKSVIESRILASSSITSLINKQAMQEADVQKAYKIFSDLSKNTEEKENGENLEETERNEEEAHESVEEEDKTSNESAEEKEHPPNNNVANLIISEHDYANFCENPDVEEEEGEEDDQSCADSLSPVPIPHLEVLPVTRSAEVKTLHRSLTLNNRRKLFLNNYGLHNWSSTTNSDLRKSKHSISISRKDGAVLRAFYQDFNLVIAQQNKVSFWTQSALGEVLGAQNMWIPKGQIQRIPLNSKYVRKNAIEMVISTETSVAYVELWTKEHKSDIREVPVADVFATVYFWRLRQSGLDKKALQLENIKGFADDVQYCVLRCYPRIIVSWHSAQGTEKKTKIRSYHLAADFQTVANISEIQPVEHYVSSLHNIEDCESLIMGCGENKITLWNVEYGYIVATIELSNIKSPLSTLWVKCDRGFLFTIQECVDQELRLIAINGMNHSWKKLQNYSASTGFDSLKGVCIENGILIAYYSQGILCWNAQSGELIVEEVTNDCEYISSGKYVIMIVNENIIVRHSLSHLITDL